MQQDFSWTTYDFTSGSTVYQEKSQQVSKGRSERLFGMLLVTCQVAFLTAVYAHAWAEGLVDWRQPPHISGVLDDKTRSLIGAAIGLFSLFALRGLESSRTIAHAQLRKSLASVVGLGIVGVCLCRESKGFLIHGFFAITVFVAGWILVLVVSSCHQGAWRSSALLSGLTLILGPICGAAYQSGCPYGSFILAVGEWALVVTFGVSMVTITGRKGENEYAASISKLSNTIINVLDRVNNLGQSPRDSLFTLDFS